MKRYRKLKSIKNRKKKYSSRKLLAPPTIRHSALKGTGYNRNKEKRQFEKEIRDFSWKEFLE